MDWSFPYASSRMPVLARNCVATTQPLAAQAGLAMLAKGGSAVDAALATAITLTVVEPVMNGIGGDAFAIVHDGKKLHGINASGRAPAGWHRRRFGVLDKMPEIGWDTVTVPGAVSGWAALHEHFGRLPFETLFEPALRYARDGFFVSPVIVAFGDYDIHELPPNGQGISALIALGILDRCDISGLGPDSADFVHLQIEATKIGMAEVRAHVGDPDAMRVSAAELLGSGRL